VVLENGGNPNAVEGRGTLHWVSASNPASVRLLIDAGADVNMRAPGSTNNTPLHHAAGNAESTRLLLAAGADPNLRNNNGESPLDLALQDASHEVVDLLR
jgi:ankyrin repeat protein